MGEKVFTVTSYGHEVRYRAARFTVTECDLVLFGPRRPASGTEDLVAAFPRGSWSAVHEESARLGEVTA